MASQQTHHLTNNIKRVGFFGNPPSGQVDHNVPLNHFALVFLDNAGRLQFKSSPSVQDKLSTVFTSEVLQNFLAAVQKRSVSREPDASTISPRFKRRRINTSDCVTNDCSVEVFDTPISGSDDSPSCGNNTVFLRIGETQAISEYYERALKRFQQLNCRTVAKAFIKFIEPSKQVKHPYNGGRKPAPGSAPESTPDPEKTKPEWWPPGIMHKEPDHLRKEYRIPLLVHIIRKLKDHGVTADKLKEVAEDTKRSLKHPSDINIILEILRVRRMEERYEDGEVDDNTLVKVEFNGPSAKGDDDEGPTDSPDVSEDATGQIGEDLSTPNYSIEQPAASPTSSNTMGMPAYSIPGNCTPLVFESQQGRHSYVTPTQDKHLSPQSVHSTPVTAEMSRTHNTPVSDYRPQNVFPISTPNQPCGILSPYDAWSMSSFPDNTVNYGTPPSPQPLSQPSIPYGLSMESPALLPAVSSHGQSSEDPVRPSRLFHLSSGVACTVCNPSR